MKQKWYLQTWLIVILCAFWFFIIPGIIGIVLLVLQIRSNHKAFLAFESEKKQIEELKQKLDWTSLEQVHDQIDKEKQDYARQKVALEKEIANLTQNREEEKKRLLADVAAQVTSMENELIRLKDEESRKKAEILRLSNEIAAKRVEVIELDDEILYQSFGFYEPKYNCMDSEEYKEKIKQVRTRQKQLISNKTALNYYDGWTLDGSASKGRAMNNDNMKMVLLAFNGECDTAIHKVKFNNIERIEEKIQKAAAKIDKLNTRNKISIRQSYIDLKLEELYLSYEYEQKKQEEKEEMRRIREQEREEQKLKKEIEDARKAINKEQSHYQNALSLLLKQIDIADGEEQEALLQKKAEIEQHLAKIDDEIKSIDYRESNQRAGYVYVISNIGSFGENIFKIGMTRRLEPQDRVDELGDASVPFRFDVHAMIFSDDAPALENALHKAFEDKKVNMMNNRKEFFHVTLEEIENVVKKNYDKTVEFIKIPPAEQYRETVMLRKNAS
ncbi:DUF4041 domain-containing protein [Clostridiales bacterium]|nr:DUF4041 domain-containing protein [Clostridiales bacterium]